MSAADTLAEVAEVQMDLFEIPPCGATILAGIEGPIDDGKPGATLIEWDGGSALAVKRAVVGFTRRAGIWGGETLRRDGWFAGFSINVFQASSIS